MLGGFNLLGNIFVHPHHQIEHEYSGFKISVVRNISTFFGPHESNLGVPPHESESKLR